MAEGRIPSLSIERGKVLTFENLHLGPATALVFENRDGYHVDEWLDRHNQDDYEHVALMCYWLDEKLIHAPDTVRIAQIYKEYEDQPGETTVDLILVRDVVDRAEPVAAMISRAATVTGIQHVNIATNFANLAALEDLLHLLIDTPVRTLNVAAQTLVNVARQVERSDGTVIQQLPREPWMPSIIRRRTFGAPPSPGSSPSFNRQLQ